MFCNTTNISSSKSLSLAIIGLLLLARPFDLRAQDDRTYLIQAAFVYRFLSFVDFPESRFDAADSTIRVGILGDSPFGNSFDSVEGSTIGNLRLEIEIIDREHPIDSLGHFHVLYITQSMKNNLSPIIEALSDSPTLTISDLPGFAESGGMIEFLKRGERVRFIVNNGVAELKGINIRSNMLRVAETVIF